MNEFGGWDPMARDARPHPSTSVSRRPRVDGQARRRPSRRTNSEEK